MLLFIAFCRPVTPFISIGMPTDAAVSTAFIIASDDDDGDAAGEDYDDHDHDHEEVSKWVS